MLIFKGNELTEANKMNTAAAYLDVFRTQKKKLSEMRSLLSVGLKKINEVSCIANRRKQENNMCITLVQTS